jgi:hypothetical protein
MLFLPRQQWLGVMFGFCLWFCFTYLERIFTCFHIFYTCSTNRLWQTTRVKQWLEIKFPLKIFNLPPETVFYSADTHTPCQVGSFYKVQNTLSSCPHATEQVIVFNANSFCMFSAKMYFIKHYFHKVQHAYKICLQELAQL